MDCRIASPTRPDVAATDLVRSPAHDRGHAIKISRNLKMQIAFQNPTGTTNAFLKNRIVDYEALTKAAQKSPASKNFFQTFFSAKVGLEAIRKASASIFPQRLTFSRPLPAIK
jgi:hypothetical protein